MAQIFGLQVYQKTAVWLAEFGLFHVKPKIVTRV